MERLNKLLDELSFDENVFSQNSLLLLAQPFALELIENEILKIQSLTELDETILKYIFSSENEDIINSLKNNEINLENLLHLLKNEDLTKIDNARQCFSISEIVEKYQENPLHLGFMADADGFMYQNSDNGVIVNFGIDNYEERLDIQMIREMIRDDREESNELMHFDAIIGYNQE